MTNQQKDLSIETLRGLAIILVVTGHVIGSKSDGGMNVADDSFLRHLYYTFQYLRMPLFTVISGWVYSLRPVKPGQWLDFNIKKVRRIMLPLIFVGGIYYTLQSLIPGTNYSHPLGEIWKILVFPYTFFWYLQALFIVFIIISIIDINNLAFSFNRWLIVFFLSLLFLFVRDVLIPESFPNFLGFKGAIYLFPFFLIGVGIKRFPPYFRKKTFVNITVVVLVLGLIMQQLIWYGIINYKITTTSILGLLIGVSGVVICLRIHFSIKWLVWIGNYAYTIFLFHSFGTSGTRIILYKLGFTNTAVIFLSSLILGILLPILIEFIIDRYNITRVLFLGRGKKKR
jgi:glucans biosynthesis protein C